MPSIGKMNIHRRGMGGRNPKKDRGGEFWRRWQGAVDAGYSREQSGTIASSEALERFATNLKARTRKRG